jgi:hypothetical protein
MNEKAQVQVALKVTEKHSPSALLMKFHYLKVTHNLLRSLYK